MHVCNKHFLIQSKNIFRLFYQFDHLVNIEVLSTDWLISGHSPGSPKPISPKR